MAEIIDNPPSATGRKPLGKALGILIKPAIVLLLLGIGGGWWMLHLPAQEAPADAGRFTALENEIVDLRRTLDESKQQWAALQARLETLEERTQGSAAPPDAAADPAWKDRLNQLEEKLGALEKSPAAAREAENKAIELQTQLDVMRHTVNALSSTVTDETTKIASKNESSRQTIALMLAYDRLRDAIQSGGAYEAQLGEVTRLLPPSAHEQEAIRKLAEYAEQGLPSLPQLQESFGEATHDAMADKYKAGDNDGWMKKLKGNLAQIVTIRKIGAAPASMDDEAVIGRAEANLHNNEVKEALSEIETLSDAARPAFAEWENVAAAYAGAPDWLTQLRGLILAPQAEPQETP